MSDIVNNLRECIYISPSGKSFTLKFDDLDRTITKKVAIHELININAADVQDKGSNAERISLVVYLTGSNCYQVSDALYDAINEKGLGILEHPRYGNLTVQPLTFLKQEKFVVGIGKVDIKIDFIVAQEKKIFPIVSQTTANIINSNGTQTVSESATTASETISIQNASELTAIKNNTLEFVDSMNTIFKDIVALSEDIQKQFNEESANIIKNIDTLLSDPELLFTSVSNLATLPAKVEGNIQSKINAYGKQIETIVSRIPESYAEAIALVESLFYCLIGVSSSTTIGNFISRTQALETIEAIKNIEDSAQNYIETSSNYTPNYVILDSVFSLSAEARNLLSNTKYSLKTEKKIIVETEKTILEVLSENYDNIQDIDSALHEFIATNNLYGDDIILLPKNKEVVVYV